MKKQLNIMIPYQILSLKELKLNSKLVYGFHFSLKDKMGYSEYTNIEIGRKLNIHQNIVCQSHKELVNRGFLQRDKKDKRRYTVTNKYEETQTRLDDKREILIRFEVYSSTKINTGSKLLWGEYNSFSKGEKKYFMARSKTALRLGVSKQSITEWTKKLCENGFLKEYYHKKGYCTSQRIVITKTFDRLNNLKENKEDISHTNSNNRNELEREEKQRVELPLDEECNVMDVPLSQNNSFKRVVNGRPKDDIYSPLFGGSDY